MCDIAPMTKDMFAALGELRAGRRVYLVSYNNTLADEVEIEGVICGDRNLSPEKALGAHCHAFCLDKANRRCLPVILPDGLKAENAKGFKAVRNGSLIHIEFTP